MFKIEQITKDWKEAGSFQAHINLYGFWDEHCFLTKTGDLGSVLRIGGIGLFIVGVIIARIATRHDVEILRVLFNSGKFRGRYDPMKADTTEIRIARRNGQD